MSIFEWGFILALLLLAITLIGRQQARWLAVLAVLATVVVSANHRAEQNSWNVFHYYLGSKYFEELGYDGLYSCAIQVVGEGQRAGVQFGSYGRDLITYEFAPVADLANCPRESFTDARWQQFGADMTWILRSARPGMTNNILLDKGYNMLPVWTAIVQPLANVAPPGTLQFMALLYADVLAISAGLLMMWRARGVEATAVATIFTTTYFGTYQIISGNWMQFLWLGAALAGLSAWHMDRRAIAGALLATAAALRIFPAFLFLWPLLHPKRAGRGFWAGAGGAAAFWAMAGSTTPRGLDAWIEFAEKMLIHSRHLVVEPLNVGLRNLVAMLSNPELAAAHLKFFQTAAGDIVPLNYETTPLVWLLVAFVVLLVVVATWKRRRPSFAAGIAVMFAAVVLSRYYYQILSVVAFEGDPAAMRSLLALNAILLTTAGPWQLPGYIVWMITLLAFLVAFYAVSRPFKAGWGGIEQYV